MKRLIPLLDYPIFRLTVFLAAGISFTDRFLSASVAWIYPASVFLFTATITFFLTRTSPFNRRHLFGCMASISFFLLGATLTQYQKGKVIFNWSPEPQLYWGLVEDIPQSRGKTMQAKVSVSYMRNPKDTLSGKSYQKEWIGRDILLSWIPDSLSEPLQCGDSICFHAKIGRPASTEELNGFDYGEYLLRKGISGTGIVFAGNGFRTGENDLSLRQYALTIQQKIVNLYRSQGLEGDVLAVASALTVGDRSDITPTLEATYSATGASHVLSLSGLHIGILAGILFVLFRPLHRIRHGRLITSCLVVIILWGFAFISGLSSPVIRSVIMFSLYIVSTLVSKDRFRGEYSVTLAAFLMLLYNPSYLFDISFQLSFTAVYSILLFYPLFSKLWQPKWRLLKYGWNIMALSFAAQTGTFPLILSYFGVFPTYFLLANLVVTPLSACILGSALASMILFPVPLLGDGCIMLLKASTDALNKSMYAIQQLYGSQLTSLYISGLQLTLLFILLGYLYAFWSKATPKTARSIVSALLAVNIFMATCWYERLKPSPCYLCFGRSEVYTRRGRTLLLQQSDHGLYKINGLHIGVMKSGYWRDKESPTRLSLDYVYICRGFKGNLKSLGQLFEIKEIILDSSLSDTYREALVRECQLLKISYTDMSDKGSYAILL